MNNLEWFLFINVFIDLLFSFLFIDLLTFYHFGILIYLFIC